MKKAVKRFLWTILALAAMAVPSTAGVNEFWQTLKSRSDLQLGDNIQPVTFYSLEKGITRDQRIMGGAVTTVYTYAGKNLSGELQFGGLKGLGTGDPFIPVVTASIKVEKVIAKFFQWVPPLLGESANSDLFKRLYVGPYYSYDFRNRDESYGVAGGFKFGKVE